MEKFIEHIGALGIQEMAQSMGSPCTQTVAWIKWLCCLLVGNVHTSFKGCGNTICKVMLQGSLTLVWLMCEDFNKYSLEHRAAHVLVRFVIPQLSLVSHRLSTIADRLLIRLLTGSFAERLEFKMSATDAEPK